MFLDDLTLKKQLSDPVSYFKKAPTKAFKMLTPISDTIKSNYC